MKTLRKSLFVWPVLLLASGACSADDEQQGVEPVAGRTVEQAVTDAWIDGKLEAAYTFNRHLSAFAIDTDVENGIVTLTGTVNSDIDRDLAGEIAKGLEGVNEVENRLLVAAESEAWSHGADADSESAAQPRRSFGRWVDDATTTAAVKAKLIGNSNVAARDIDVDTRDDVVTLTGSVRSDEERDLAEALARNVPEVRELHNQLRVADAK